MKSITVDTERSSSSASSVRRDAHDLVEFCLDGWHYALHLAAVERILRMAEVIPLPKAPEIVQGVINVQGRIVPVVDVRKRFRLPSREVGLTDHLILARTARRSVGLIADVVIGVAEGLPPRTVAADRILPHLEYVEGVVKLDDGLIFIHNLDMFLSLEEEKALEQAMMPT